MEWMKILDGFAVGVVIFWIGVWCLHLMAIFYGKWRLHKKRDWPVDVPLPGVSVIKPLTGTDTNLFVNLETFFTMKYPVYELLFCAHDDSEPALMVVRKLMNKYPSVDAKIFIGRKVGVNPKINNMIPAYEAAKYDLILISDCGIRMKEDTLLDMVSHMSDDVGLVHQMPFVCDRDGFAATLEKIYFGTVHARIYLSADLLRVNCPTGMSCMIRKKILEEAGGLRAFGCYLAEDFFMAKAVTDRGWKLTISSQPAWQNSGYCKVLAFQSRMTRWAKLRFAMVPHTLVLEPLSECMLLGVLASTVTWWLFEWSPLAVFLTHILCWLILDWLLLNTVQNDRVPFSKVDFIIGWVFREVYAPYLFMNAVWEPTIRWRTGTYRLRWGGVAEEVIDCKDTKS